MELPPEEEPIAIVSSTGQLAIDLSSHNRLEENG